MTVPFEVGQHVKAKLKRGEVVHKGDSRIVDKYRYTVKAVEGDRIGVDDGNPRTRWPAELFVGDD